VSEQGTPGRTRRRRRGRPEVAVGRRFNERL